MNTIDVIILGLGNVGRAFVEIVRTHNRGAKAQDAPLVRVLGVADRSTLVACAQGLSDDSLVDACACKARGEGLGTLIGAIPSERFAGVVERVFGGGQSTSPRVLVDVSDADEVAGVYLEAIGHGAHIATANKKALAGVFDAYLRLVRASRERGVRIGARSTVGAGLPVLDTVRALVASGDRVRTIEGCMSGTLGFIMTALEQGAGLSESVGQAIERGYTEPDPLVDLSGGDVARKALILGRSALMLDQSSTMTLSGLVPEAFAGTGPSELLGKLRGLDGAMRERVSLAQREGKVLRYAARVSPGVCEVGVREVAGDSPLASLRGTDNMFTITTDRYASRPIVIAGPGAGSEVTAAGVFVDVLAAIRA